MPGDRPLRIALLSPRGPLYRHRSGIWKRSLRYPPLTLTTLAALVPPELNAEVMILDEGIDEIDQALTADLIGISAITGTAPRAYELAEHYRSRGVPVVLGGVHPTLMPDEAQQHADTVVTGYAEESWPQLLRDFVAGRMQPRYTQSSMLTLAGLPRPKRELLPWSRFISVQTIEATRGCIHQCEFCVVPSAWGRPLQKPVGDVITELKEMNARRVIFLDLNLISDKAYIKELWTAMIPLKLTWGGLSTTLLAWDEELLDLAARSGCRGLLMGLESLSDDALGEVRKGFNQRKDYRLVIERLHERKIALMGCFVFGFDSDTQETFREVAEFAIDAGIDLPRFAALTPFPGTPLFRRMKDEGRLLTEDWSLYDGQHVVFRPARLTPDELQRGIEWTWKHVYSYPSIARRLAKSRTLLNYAIPANLGYRFYAHNLHRFYTCREALL